MTEKKRDIAGWKIALIVISILILILGATIIGIVQTYSEQLMRRATINDFDGYWTETINTKTFTFIPSRNIKNLSLRIVVSDSNDNLVNAMVKEIGNVKRGHQYTVTLSLSEYFGGSEITIIPQGHISIF